MNRFFPTATASMIVLVASACIATADETFAPANPTRLDTYMASERSFEAAVGAHRRNQLDAAAAGYEAALALDPEFVEAQVNLARIDIDAGRYDEAARRLQDAVSRRPDYPALYRVRGLLELETGSVMNAIEDFSFARTLAPDDAELLLNLGAALLVRGRLADAEKVLLEALQYQPDSESALLNLALAQDRAGRHFYAATTYRRFLQMSQLDDADRSAVLARLSQIDGHFAPLVTKPHVVPPDLAEAKPGK